MKKTTLLLGAAFMLTTLTGCGNQGSETRISRVIQENVTGDVVYAMEARAPKQPEIQIEPETARQSETEESVQPETQNETEKSVQLGTQIEAEESVQPEAQPETEESVQPETQPLMKEPVQPETDEYGRISREHAIAIVLARIPGASADQVYIKLDQDDGHWEYEGEVYYDHREYEFEMNAMNGKIHEWSEDD